MSLVRKFASVGGATMASRILGFVREALIGAALGAGPVADAFYAAFRFPNLFRRIFAEGAFNTAFIPLFAKQLEGGGVSAARRFAEEVASVLIAALLALSALAIIFMPALVATVIAPAFADNPEKFDLTVVMTRIMFPYLLCMSLVAMLSGVLNSMRRYFLAALVPILLNVILIAILCVAVFSGIDQGTVGIWLACGVFLSGIAQLFFLVWGVRREGFRLTMRLPRLTPSVRRLLILMGPAVLTGGVTQINLLVGQIIASAQDGAIALLNYADRIAQLPLGVIGIAIGVVLLPELARALKAGQENEVQHLQNRSLEFALGLTLPAAIGMMVLPGPIVALIYERGAFTPAATAMTAGALAAFAAGLPAYVLAKVFQPAFFAREDMRTPMWFSIIAVAVNIGASLSFFPIYGHLAIAAATSLSGWVNMLMLAGALAWRGHFRPSGLTIRRIAMITLASVVMGAVTWALASYLEPVLRGPSGLVRLACVVGIIAAAAFVYVTLVIATGGLDRTELARFLRRRAVPGRPAASASDNENP